MSRAAVVAHPVVHPVVFSRTDRARGARADVAGGLGPARCLQARMLASSRTAGAAGHWPQRRRGDAMWASSRAADGVAGADRERLHAEAHLALVGGDVVDLRAQQAPVQLGGGAGGDRRCGQPLRRWPCRAWPMPLAVTGRVAAWMQKRQSRAESALLCR
ncbi:MAG: hypothetical protein J5X22_08370 [Candidatus Accumulibacter sp.]|uniref:hypothetical protein n=1 Tax=Accumulibacter sp. TaxID=2053492 RepID=UPI001B257DD2|nr:hypothetical protein [Accumulibacter sp.]MBO3710516.1 hypothetical protein [Accumulibacter sp.]